MRPAKYRSVQKWVNGKRPGATRRSVIDLTSVTPKSGASFRYRGLSAPLGLPNAGAGSERALALPGAGAGGSRQAALAVGPLAGTRDADPHAPVGKNMSLQIDRPAAVIDDVPVVATHAVPIGAVAAAALGHDDDAPIVGRGVHRR